MQSLFENIFYKPKNKSFLLVNDFLSLLTIISVISISLETVNEFKEWKNFFYFIEIFSTFFFALEYIGRIWAADKKISYIFSFFGFVDFLAILPTILGFGNLNFLKMVRLFRILRFLRILRITKLAQITSEDIKIEDRGDLVKINLEIYLTLFLIFSFFSATSIWLIEEDQRSFSNIPYALMWSIKILLGGVSQEIPSTFSGELIVILTRFFGLILFALMINLIANFFKKFFLNKKNNLKKN